MDKEGDHSRSQWNPSFCVEKLIAKPTRFIVKWGSDMARSLKKSLSSFSMWELVFLEKHLALYAQLSYFSPKFWDTVFFSHFLVNLRQMSSFFLKNCLLLHQHRYFLYFPGPSPVVKHFFSNKKCENCFLASTIGTRFQSLPIFADFSNKKTNSIS